MPLIKPGELESERHFIARAIKYLKHKYGKRYTNKQRIAIAYDSWRKK